MKEKIYINLNLWKLDFIKMFILIVELKGDSDLFVIFVYMIVINVE